MQVRALPPPPFIMRRDKCPTGTSWCYTCKKLLLLEQFTRDASRVNLKNGRCIRCCSTAKPVEPKPEDPKPPVYNLYETYMNTYNAKHPTFIPPAFCQSRWNQPTSDEVRAATAARKAVLDQWDLEFLLKKKEQAA